MAESIALKLKNDFFKRHDVKIIESMDGGKETLLIYLKLLCESLDHDGRLRFSADEPYTAEMLATILNEDKVDMEKAMENLTELGLMKEEDDGTFVMPKAQGMSTSPCSLESEEEEQTERIPVKRTRVNYKQVMDWYNGICVSFPQLTVLSERRKKAIKARLSIYEFEDFKTLFEKAEASDFLKGKNEKSWSADFDWLIRDANMAKVLDGKYDNRKRRGNYGGSRQKQEMDEFYAMVGDWAKGGK